MRPVNFRGWNEKHKRWLHGYFTVSRGRSMIVGERFNPIDCDIEDYEIDLKTLGQYTGLQDKNGTDIYEGDIIRYEEHEGYLLESFIAEVVFENGAFGYRRKDGVLGGIEVEPFCEHGCLKEDFLNYVEVVGNGYDDKEWLDV